MFYLSNEMKAHINCLPSFYTRNEHLWYTACTVEALFLVYCVWACDLSVLDLQPACKYRVNAIFVPLIVVP